MSDFNFSKIFGIKMPKEIWIEDIEKANKKRVKNKKTVKKENENKGSNKVRSE